MHRIIQRLLCLGFATIVLLSVFLLSACSIVPDIELTQQSQEAYYKKSVLSVGESKPWYDVTQFSFVASENEELADIQEFYSWFPTRNGVLLLAKRSNYIDFIPEHWSDVLCYIDYSCQLIWSKNLVNDNLIGNNILSEYRIISQKDKYILVCETLDGDAFFYDINLSEGFLSRIDEVGIYYQKDRYILFGDNIGCEEIKVGDNTVTFFTSLDGLFMYIQITYPNGSKKLIEINNIVNHNGEGCFRYMVPIGDGFAAIGIGQGEYSDTVLYILDLHNETLSRLNFDDKLAECQDTMFFFDGDGLFLRTPLAIYKVNILSNTTSLLIDFTQSNVNVAELTDMDMLVANGDEIVIGGDSSDAFKTSFSIYRFRECGENPNLGKVILNAAYLDELTLEEGAAVRKFNMENDDYFVQLQDKYARNSNLYPDLLSYESYDNKVIELLEKDIVNESVPDILLNSYNHPQIRYYADLIQFNDLLEDEIYSDFNSNIMGIACSDGAIREIPLTFGFYGLVVPSKVTTGDGITYEAFDNLVFEYLSYTTEESPLLGNGVISDKFSEVAYYNSSLIDSDVVRDYYYESVDNYSSVISEYLIMNSVSLLSMGINAESPKMLTISGYDDWILATDGGRRKFVGLPSQSPVLPIVFVRSSVALLKDCVNVDGAMEFLNCLFDSEILSTASAVTISDSTNSDNVRNTIQRYNDWVLNEYNMYAQNTRYEELVYGDFGILARVISETQSIQIPDAANANSVYKTIVEFLASDSLLVGPVAEG